MGTRVYFLYWVLGPCLAWTCAGFEHAAIVSVSPYAYQLSCIWKTLFPWHQPMPKESVGFSLQFHIDKSWDVVGILLNKWSTHRVIICIGTERWNSNVLKVPNIYLQGNNSNTLHPSTKTSINSRCYFIPPERRSSTVSVEWVSVWDEFIQILWVWKSPILPTLDNCWTIHIYWAPTAHQAQF